MNHNKLIAVGLILTIGVFLAAGCTGGEKEYKDCGTATNPQSEEMECFSKALEDCKPAELTVEPNEEEVKMEYTVEGGEPENCKVTWKIIKSEEKYSELEGEQITCNITETPEENQLPNFGKAYNEGNCENTAPEKFEHWLGEITDDPGGVDQAKKGFTVKNCDTNENKILVRNTGSVKIDQSAIIYQDSDEIGKALFNNAPLEPGNAEYIDTTANFTLGETYIITGEGLPTVNFAC